MRRLILCFLLSAGVSVGGGAQGFKPEGVLATDEQKAALYWKEEKWAELRDLTLPWVKREPENAKPLYYLGRAQFELGAFAPAAETLVRVRALMPKEPERLIFMLARAQEETGQFEAAEKSYREILRAHPQNTGVWQKLYDAIVKQKRKDKEVDELIVLERLLSLPAYRNNLNYWRRAAQLFSAYEKPVKARVAHGHILRMAPKDLPSAEWVFHYDLAREDEERTERNAKRLLRIAPEHTLARFFRAEQAFEKELFVEARRHYEVVLKNRGHPRENAVALVRLVDLGARQPLNGYNEALRRDPSYLPAWEGAIVQLRGRKHYYKAQFYEQQLNIVRRRLERGEAVTPQNIGDFYVKADKL